MSNQHNPNAVVALDNILKNMDMETMVSPLFKTDVEKKIKKFDKAFEDLTLYVKSKTVLGEDVFNKLESIWSLHRSIIEAFNPNMPQIMMMCVAASQSEDQIEIMDPVDLKNIETLFALYLKQYKNVAFLGLLNDFLIDQFIKLKPDEDLPSGLIKYVFPKIQHLELGDYQNETNIFYKMMKGTRFQPHNSDKAVNVMIPVEPQSRCKTIYDLMNMKGMLSISNRAMPFQDASLMDKNVAEAFQYCDCPTFVYIDRTVNDNNEAVYTFYSSVITDQVLAPIFQDFGFLMSSDGMGLEWRVSEDSQIFSNWLRLCETEPALSENSGHHLNIDESVNLKSIQMMNIANFLIGNFDYYYFSGVGLLESNQQILSKNLIEKLPDNDFKPS